VPGQGRATPHERNTIRKLVIRRWVTIAVTAAGLVGLTATSASADVRYNTNPPDNGTSLIVGPGCDTAWGTYFLSNTWTPTGGDYTGPDVYNDNYDAVGACDGTSYYRLDQATADGTFLWDIQAYSSVTENCQVYAYIPSQGAGEFNARYDFYAADWNYVPGQWLGWPGQTVNEYPNQGWTYIGGVIIPPNTPISTSNSATATRPILAGTQELETSP